MGYSDIHFPEGTVFLVTGGAGFIGSNLCEALLGKGCVVKCLDDLSTGKYENVQIFLNNPRYTFIKGDIKDYDVCLKACEGVNYVLHEAAWGSVPRSIEMPVFYLRNNLVGFANILKASKICGVKRVVYASSSSVYGNSVTLPKVEGQEGDILSPYAFTKSAGEKYAHLYARLYSLEIIGLRYFNVFGKRQDPNGAYAAVIPLFLKQLLNGERPTINGDGRQSRDFTYIENVIEANLKACIAGKEAVGKVFNIAYGGREYLIDVYNKMCTLLHVSIQPRFGPERAGDIKHSNASIKLAEKLLGYRPDYDFMTGLRESINWYRNYFSSQTK